MNAAHALRAARTVGIRVGIDGDDLVLEASAPPPTAVLDALSRHKVEVVALLRTTDDGWSAEDWQASFDERAGITQYERSLSTFEAESAAFAECVHGWLIMHPPTNCTTDLCAYCGHTKGEVGRDSIPFLCGSDDHLCLHHQCIAAFRAARNRGGRMFPTRYGYPLPECACGHSWKKYRTVRTVVMGQNTSSAVMAQRKEPKDSLDNFPTPPWATRALCEFLKRHVGALNDFVCWEPACGYGDMVHPLGEYFHAVMASDVYQHGVPLRSGIDITLHDFLMPGPPLFDVDWIVTNPPFRLAAKFARRAIEIAKVGVAMLARIAFLEGQERYLTLFSHAPPTEILQFCERVPMHKGTLTETGSTATSYCWLIWRKSVELRPPQFHWIAPCRKQLEQKGDYR